ncbi:MAG: esterase [Polyangiaceae bacterium]|nr:esterase [Polyangiaceae bacterium]
MTSLASPGSRSLRWLALLLALGCASGTGCRRAAPALSTHAFEHNGLNRVYHLHVPKGHARNRPAPLVIALHGGGGTGEKFDWSTNGQVVREADARGWLVVFPEGVEKGWNDGRPPLARADRLRAGVDDVDFLSKLIERVDAEQGVDRARVYAMGISNGGFMSYRLAIDLADRIAAVGPVTASLQKAHEREKPERPVSVMIVNGTDDPLVPYGGGQVRVLGRDRGEVLSTDDTVKWWRKVNGCTLPAVVRTLPDADPDDGARVHVEAHEGCSEGSAVVLYRVEGGGHTWPGGAQYLPRGVIGGVCRDFDATRELFDFFAKHRR